MAQETLTPIPVKQLSENSFTATRYLGTDALGCEYSITNNTFQKKQDGKTVKYKAVSLSTIYRADLQNPLQIVLFYKKFNTVVLLDNQLNETARINFSELQQPLLAEAVGLASQNRLWVYDTNTQQVGLYDIINNTFKTLTPPFNQTLTDYQSNYNYFYWVDSLNNMYAVNLFGKVNTLGTLPEFEHLQLVNNKQIILQKNNNLHLYNLENKSLQKIDIAEKSFENFNYSAQILSIFTKNKITHSKIILPE
ncbi:hypothetical protein [uncultured Flavobacterium sp.]|uniref:hypothetical protein n=1 Tax=uncultured Flavobacterium sp. TaxID=165435 RepID=UPI000AEB290B|nr:hypothetical protein [uncultured Flavobacterium sp.]